MTAITHLTRDHELHVYRFWHNSRTLHIYLFYVTSYRSRDGPNVPIEGQAMTEEQEDELTNLPHLIVERLATLEQINRFNFLRKQVEARNLVCCSGEHQLPS